MQACTHDFVGLLEVVDFQSPQRRLAVAVERLRGNFHLHRIPVRLPFLRGERRLQRRVARVHTALARTRLARRVRHVGMDRVVKSRLVLFRHGGIGLRIEIDHESSIRLRHGRAVRDLLRALRRHGPPPETRAPPARKTHLAHHAILHLRIADCRARVGGRLTGHRDFRVQLRRLLRCIHRHLEFRPLVFLHVESSTAVRLALGADHHVPREPVARRSEAAAERSIVVRLVLRPRDFLPVYVLKNHRERLPAERLVVVLVPIRADADPLVLDRLPRTIQRAVREESRLRMHIGLTVLAVIRIRVARSKLLILMRHVDERPAPLRCLAGEASVRIRLRLRPCTEFPIVLLHPELDVRALDRIARIRLQREALDLFIAPLPAHHERKIAHPEIRE